VVERYATLIMTYVIAMVLATALTLGHPFRAQSYFPLDILSEFLTYACVFFVVERLRGALIGPRRMADADLLTGAGHRDYENAAKRSRARAHIY
jgi:hypothetical protein